MSEMVDRVVREIEEEFARQKIHASAGALAFTECLPPLDVAAVARAAIQAMREPTDAMVGLGLPSFSGGGGKPTTATLYASHYHRLLAVLDAARTGNSILIKLAVENQDKMGYGAE